MNTRILPVLGAAFTVPIVFLGGTASASPLTAQVDITTHRVALRRNSERRL